MLASASLVFYLKYFMIRNKITDSIYICLEEVKAWSNLAPGWSAKQTIFKVWAEDIEFVENKTKSIEFATKQEADEYIRKLKVKILAFKAGEYLKLMKS